MTDRGEFVMEKWVVSAKRADFQEIGRKFGIDPVIARLIRNRDQITDEEIDTYLHGKLSGLHPWKLLKGMEELLDRLMGKIRDKKRSGSSEITILTEYVLPIYC